MKQVIARHAPMSDKVVIFMADSKQDNKIDVFTDGVVRTVDMDYYKATYPISLDDAKKVAAEFAKYANIPSDEVLLRQRLAKAPKEQPRRRLNDANLVLVENGDKKADELAIAAQALHDGETGKDVQKTEEAAPRQKRAYNKKSSKEVSKRSAAALKRYHEELQAANKDAPEMLEAPAPTVSKEVLDESILELALKLAVILKKNPGLL